MGVDITSTFKSCIIKRKEHDKLINDICPTEKPKPHVRRRCPFVTKCREVTSSVSELRDFLLEHRKAYLSLGPDYLHNKHAMMTDNERDNVDTGAQVIIKTSSQLLCDLKRNLYTKDDADQTSETHKAIIDLLEAYLKSVTKIYTEMKATRVKWTVEVQKISRFEPVREEASVEDRVEPKPVEERKLEGTSYTPLRTPYNYEDETPLSDEEMQLFQMENDHLYNELNSLNEEVKSIQSKVVKIAELQEVFTEKVLEQNEDIERISTTLVGTTENLKDANTQIRKAIQNNASFRIYVLFFILMMSFCLLFLDWYND